MERRRIAGCAAALLALSGSAVWAQTGHREHRGKAPAKTTLSASDKKFMRDAAQGGMSEVALGKLAAQHGASAAVKAFGQRMVDDHSKANHQLMQIAAHKGVTLPKTMNAEQRELQTKLSRLHGAAFDALYPHEMVEDHEKDVAEFQKEAKNGRDADVKGFAAQTVPTLREHLSMARSLPSGNGKKMHMGTAHTTQPMTKPMTKPR